MFNIYAILETFLKASAGRINFPKTNIKCIAFLHQRIEIIFKEKASKIISMLCSTAYFNIVFKERGSRTLLTEHKSQYKWDLASPKIFKINFPAKSKSQIFSNSQIVTILRLTTKKRNYLKHTQSAGISQWLVIYC